MHKGILPGENLNDRLILCEKSDNISISNIDWISCMNEKGIHIDYLPELQNPILIAGFDGWGNALEISTSMVSYLINKLGAKAFAAIDPDVFYRYDEARPKVEIEAGILKKLSYPGGSLYAVNTAADGKDLVILKAAEPSLRWLQFVDELFFLCDRLGIKTVITIGSMFDNVLHLDRIISGTTSNPDLFSKPEHQHVLPISYQGPSAIHSVMHVEGLKRGIQSASLWCHCPYYLQGTPHFGLLSTLGSLLSATGEFELDVEDLEASWTSIKDKIQGLIDKNPELQEIINELRKAKVRGSWANAGRTEKKDDKVINLRDFLETR